MVEKETKIGQRVLFEITGSPSLMLLPIVRSKTEIDAAIKELLEKANKKVDGFQSVSSIIDTVTIIQSVLERWPNCPEAKKFAEDIDNNLRKFKNPIGWLIDNRKSVYEYRKAYKILYKFGTETKDGGYYPLSYALIKHLDNRHQELAVLLYDICLGNVSRDEFLTCLEHHNRMLQTVSEIPGTSSPIREPVGHIQSAELDMTVRARKQHSEDSFA